MSKPSPEAVKEALKYTQRRDWTKNNWTSYKSYVEKTVVAVKAIPASDVEQYWLLKPILLELDRAVKHTS